MTRLAHAGMPLPAYAMPGAMTGAFWPGVAGGRGAPAGGHQGGGKADKFNSMSVAYYSAYGPQQMAAAVRTRLLRSRALGGVGLVLAEALLEMQECA